MNAHHRHAPLLLLLVILVIMALASCSRDHDPLSPPAATDVPVAVKNDARSADVDTVFGYAVRYGGRTFDGQQTTFAYNVTGTDVAELPTFKFYLELPDCAPELAGYSPEAADVGYFSQPGFYGIRWIIEIQPDDPEGQDFSLTFDGEVDEGVILTAIRIEDGVERGVVHGPCGGNDVTGRVFVDADEDGVFQPETEGGLANVLVQAVDGDGRVWNAVTDSTGLYRFRVVDGVYTVSVDTTASDGYFNGDLGTWWQPTTTLSHEVVVPPDAAGLHVGFRPLVEDIVEDVVDGDLESSGVPAKFWLNELYWAIDPTGLPEGGSWDVLPFQTPVFTPEELLAFLLEIEQLALFEPFQFTDGLEFEEALLILSTDTGSLVQVLEMELLATELNYVADQGFVDDPAMLEALIIWGESLVNQYRVELQRELEEGGGRLSLQRIDDLRIAIGVFHAINVGGGGGFDE